MPVKIPSSGYLSAFAMIVDINGFTRTVAGAEGEDIAQYTRDVLMGGIVAVEKHGGEVVGLMGDAFYAIFSDADEVFLACTGIAVDLEKQREYLSESQEAFPYASGGPGLKIGIEYGELDVSPIWTKYLGQQNLFIGPAVNYASRITAAGRGNRCLVGPNAAEKGLSNYRLKEPLTIKGKKGEPPYRYYELNLDDIWTTISGR